MDRWDLLNHKPHPWRWAGDKGTSLLRIVGSCGQRLFGLEPAERLRRQKGTAQDPVLVAHASAVLSDAAIHWLIENPGQVLTTPAGTPAAVACAPAEVEGGERWIKGEAAPQSVNPTLLEPMFIRKLRRRDTLLVRRLDESPVATVERELFGTVYKGVTDLVTKYAWPVPAFWATKFCARLGIGPNPVTILGIALVAAVAYLWAEGQMIEGLVLAWLMTFLDTLDGKLARVTVRSTWLGNILDHATDIIHPPVWWACLAIGLERLQPAFGEAIWMAFGAILASYVLGRGIEELFKRRTGYNAYLWQPFDSAFRLIVSRRNVILLIMTAGFVSGTAVQAYLTVAAWTVLSVFVQLVRFIQAAIAARHRPIEPWLK